MESSHVCHVLLGLLLALFTAGICARPLHRSHQAPGEIIKNYEVFTPIIEYDEEQAVSRIFIVTSGNNFTLHLTMNRHLLSSEFSSSHYDSQSKVVVTKGHPNCFYHGEVDGHPSWTSVISTCHGLRGSFGNMAVKTELYHIEPLTANLTKSLDQSHIIFLETEYRSRTKTCGTSHNHSLIPEIMQRQELVQLKGRVRRQTPGNLIVELVIVNDFSQYQKYGNNLESTVNRAIEVTNGADSLYKPLGIRVVLVQVITWSSGDKISVVPDSGTLLENFRVFARAVTSEHDVTMLLTGISLNSHIVGLAYVGSMCTSYSVDLVEDFGSLPAVSSTTAHEIGHLLSMIHDTASCTCAQSTGCIMSAVQGYVVPNQWSSCSTQSLTTALASKLGFCLTNQPQTIVGPPVCGNGIHERNETCDCGSPQVCTDPCCNPATCQLAAGAQCASGDCCKNCRFVSYGTLCRASSGECDIAEVCTGCSSQCPGDQYVQYGTLCGSGTGYCYGGACPTRDNQCKAFYGSSGGDGVSSCYSNYNIRGDLHGNCGPTGASTYATCSASNVFCGSLQCANTGNQFPDVSISGSIQLGTHGFTATQCKSFIATPDDGSITNIWLVQNGTKCGSRQICLSGQCFPLSTLSVPSCPVGSNGLPCSGNGACSSAGTCVCKVGFTGYVCGSTYAGPVCLASSPPPSSSQTTSIAPRVSSTSLGTSIPVRVTSTPVRIISTPVRVTSTPVGVASTPVRVTSTPVGVTSTPVRIASTPVRVTSTPVGVTSIPVRITSTPVGVTSTPVRITSTPAGVTSTPLRITSTPVRVISTPVRVTSTPVRVTSTPVRITSPVRVTSTPVGVTSTPVRIASTPVRVTSTPVGVTSTPVRITSTPVRVISTPVRVTSTPVGVTSTPVRITSPVGVTSTPVRITSPVGVTSARVVIMSTQGRPISTVLSHPISTTSTQLVTPSKNASTSLGAPVVSLSPTPALHG